MVAAGTYQVSAVSSGLCLDIAGGSTANGAKVQQQACTGAASQHFELRADTGGSVRLVDVASGKSLDVTDVSTANGAKIQQWTTAATDNQRFLVTASGAGVALKAVNSGKLPGHHRPQHQRRAPRCSSGTAPAAPTSSSC